MVIPVQGMRAVIARRMAESARTAASFSVSTEVDASAMVRLREETSGVLGARGIILSFTAIIVRACALALREYPALNSSFSVDGIRIHSRVNVGVAVALDDGLVVPVVRDADSKSLPSVAAEIEGFAKAARGGRLKPADLEGGTFTVSNLGMTGVTSFVPIINLPEACILGVGSVIKRPLVTAGGTVEVRPVMALNLTVDHRVTDGWQAAQFLMRVKRRLEEAASLLL